MSKSKTDSLPAQQGETAVGPGHPPEEHQFKPGQSGNPNGSPKARTNLWKFINRFMAMTDDELAKVDRKKLTQSQQVALKHVEGATLNPASESERFVRYCIDRDEGKASEHLVIDKDNDLSDEECEEIRAVLRKAYDDAG